MSKSGCIGTETVHRSMELRSNVARRNGAHKDAWQEQLHAKSCILGKELVQNTKGVDGDKQARHGSRARCELVCAHALLSQHPSSYSSCNSSTMLHHAISASTH
eukprot:1038973-Pelagomonas_calceolata.AAC.2